MRRQLPLACQMLRWSKARLRREYNRNVRDARRRGEAVISFSEWQQLLIRACKLALSDPGGNLRL